MSRGVLIICVSVAAFCVSLISAVGRDVQTDIDDPPDHFDGNLLRTLSDILLEPVNSSLLEQNARESRDEKGGEVMLRAENLDAKTKSLDEMLLRKEMAFQEALALRNRLGQRIVPGHQCDEFITGEDFYIHSPSYPNNYPPNITCKYQVYRRNPGFCGVSFTVLRLDLATSIPVFDEKNSNRSSSSADDNGETTCKGDTLTIDGVEHCGRYARGQKALFTFPSSLLTVAFKSGDSHGASGFLLLGRQEKNCRQPKSLGKALISTVPCDRRITSDNFKLISPGYPLGYEHNVECHYIVTRGDGVCGVQLQVENFSLEDGSCMFDYLEVQGHRLCGDLQPGFTRYYEFEGFQLDIRFRTDESTRKGGFSVIGKRVKCDEAKPLQPPLSQIRPGRGEDSSTSNPFSIIPLTPSSLATNLPSVMKLSPIPVIPTNLSEIDISYILSAIGRGPLPNLNREDSFEGRENDNSTSSVAEEEDFTELDPGLITEETSTNADQNIPGNPDFNPFTGTGLPPTLPTIPGGISTGFPVTSGFPATSSFPTFPTTTFNVVSGCDEVFSELTFTVSSPNYPSPYPVSTDCTYFVGRTTVDVCALQVTIIDMNLPQLDTVTGQCSGDYLDISGTRFCGQIQNRVLTFDFPGQTIEMFFHSDATTTAKGFTMRAQQLTSCGGTTPFPPGQCDSTVQESSFVLLSPGYPAQYPPNTDCTTNVLRASTRVSSLILELVDFDLSPTLGCTGDFLDIGGQRLCGLLSGQTRSVPFVGNSLTIRFHSGSSFSPTSRTGRGFQIRVTQSTSTDPIIPGGCGGILSSYTATIQSPSYPLQYPNNAYCTYSITKASTDVCQLQLKIVEFDVEDSSGCSKDYLQIGYQERLCGRRYPGETRKYHFSHHRLDLYFRSDGFGSGQGFRVEVSQLTCGHFKPVYPTYPSYPSYPSRPSYPSYPSHHHHHHQSYRPTYTPTKAWVKPFFHHFWKKNPFSRPYQLSQSYTNHPSESHSHNNNSPENSYGPPKPTYGAPSPDYGVPSYSTTPPPYTPLNFYPTTPSPIFPSTLPGNPFTPYTPLNVYPTTPSPIFPSTLPGNPFNPFPTPLPELLAAPLNSSSPVSRPLPRPTLVQDAEVVSIEVKRQPKAESSSDEDDGTGMCNKVTNLRTFQVQSPGYPGPYYTDMRCLFRIKRSDASRCGVELLMDQFDVEETEHCRQARLVISNRIYCGTIPSGSHSVVPFDDSDEIVMEFVAGKYHSAAGFTMRGRQLSCLGNTTSTSEVSSAISFPTKTFIFPGEVEEPPHRAPFGRLVDSSLAEDDLVVPWVGFGGREPIRYDREGWKPILS